MPLKSSLLYLCFLLLFTSHAFGQLQVTGLSEDYERSKDKPGSLSQRSARTSAIAAIYSDTLHLPFIDDFSGVIVEIDSIVLTNADTVKIYDRQLLQLADTSEVVVTFLDYTNTNPVYNALFKKWFIKKVSGTFVILCNNTSLTSPITYPMDTVIYDGYWKQTKNFNYTSPDSLRWISGGNTYINNRFPVNPVSFNVATFDGLRGDGVPYNTVNVLATGYTDNLTSLPIDLSAYTPADSVYLSFFWQHTGAGDIPEDQDFLELQFKGSSGTWNTAATITGDSINMTTFRQHIVQVPDSCLFGHFQFRIRSYGRQSGPYDIWNVDYIHLDKNRSQSDSTWFDIAIGNAQESFLKNFSAMPYDQFFDDQFNEVDTLRYSINNIDRGESSTQNFQGKCESEDYFQTWYVTGNGPVRLGTSSQLTYQETFFPDVTGLSNPDSPVRIYHTYSLGLNDTVHAYFGENSRYVSNTILWDYYAYDDGTPEWGVGANQIGARVANKFKVNITDTLTDIDIYFTRSKGPNMSGRTILVSVWNNANKLVAQKAVQVSYGGFKRFTLNQPVVINAGENFMVGYQQNFVDLLSIGYDKNIDHSDKIFFHLGNGWTSYNTQPSYVPGSLMIRGVFSKGELLLSNPEAQEELTVHLFPIPANDELSIEGKVSSIKIYNLLGQEVLSKNFQLYDSDKFIATDQLKPGVYIASISNGKDTVIKRIIISH